MLSHRPFHFLRHGETDWNLSGRAQGQQDVELNPVGRTQAAATVARLIDSGITTICSSPLKRAVETASIIGRALHVPTVLVEDLKEARWGTCEGLPKGAWFARWRAGTTPTGAEPYSQFLLRALRGMNAALAAGERVLVVAHGGTYWVVEKETGFTLAGDVPNCTPIYHDPPSGKRPHWSLTAC